MTISVAGTTIAIIAPMAAPAMNGFTHCFVAYVGDHLYLRASASGGVLAQIAIGETSSNCRIVVSADGDGGATAEYVVEHLDGVRREGMDASRRTTSKIPTIFPQPADVWATVPDKKRGCVLQKRLPLGRRIRVPAFAKEILQVALGIVPVLAARGVPSDLVILH